MWYVLFFLLVIGAGYIVNCEAKFDSPIPKAICNVALALIFLGGVLNLFGVFK